MQELTIMGELLKKIDWGIGALLKFEESPALQTFIPFLLTTYAAHLGGSGSENRLLLKKK